MPKILRDSKQQILFGAKAHLTGAWWTSSSDPEFIQVRVNIQGAMVSPNEHVFKAAKFLYNDSSAHDFLLKWLKTDSMAVPAVNSPDYDKKVQILNIYT